jgi:hypothetical protein
MGKRKVVVPPVLKKEILSVTESSNQCIITCHDYVMERYGRLYSDIELAKKELPLLKARVAAHSSWAPILDTEEKTREFFACLYAKREYEATKTNLDDFTAELTIVKDQVAFATKIYLEAVHEALDPLVVLTKNLERMIVQYLVLL